MDKEKKSYLGRHKLLKIILGKEKSTKVFLMKELEKNLKGEASARKELEALAKKRGYRIGRLDLK